MADKEADLRRRKEQFKKEKKAKVESARAKSDAWKCAPPPGDYLAWVRPAPTLTTEL